MRIGKLLVLIGLAFIAYGGFVIAASTTVTPIITLPVPWSDEPVTIDNPQLEPGVVLVVLGLVLVGVGTKLFI